jgi:hypothetical protein
MDKELRCSASTTWPESGGILMGFGEMRTWPQK